MRHKRADQQKLRKKIIEKNVQYTQCKQYLNLSLCLQHEQLKNLVI